MEPSKMAIVEAPGRAGRLIEARLSAGHKSARAAALANNWHYSTYAGHENGSRAYNERDAMIYGAAFNVPAGFLLGEAGNFEFGNANQISPRPGKLLEIFHGNIRRVPLLDVLDLPTFERVMNGETVMDRTGRTEPLPSNIAAGPRAYAAKIVDGALADTKPALEPGSIGFFDPDADYSTGHIVAARIVGFPFVVLRKFRLMVGAGGEPRFDLVSTNTDFPSFSSAEHTINLVGRLIGVWVPV